MNENLNLVEILKDCPEGTKLYSSVFGEVELDHIDTSFSNYQIIIRLKGGEGHDSLTSEGKMFVDYDGECVLFPSRENRDLSKFKPTCEFKVGDWLCANELNDYANNIKIVNIVDVFGKKKYKISRDYDSDLDLVEFNFIKEHFHLWTIQDVKDGDVLVNGSNIFIFYFINNRRLMGYCHVNMNDGNFYNDIGRIECFCTIDAPVTPATKEQRDALMKAMNDAGYEWDAEKKELKKLVEPKFDPKTLHPFDRVLVRLTRDCIWNATFFSHYDKEVNWGCYPCVTTSCKSYDKCIPYNDETKHLLGTSDEAPEYYRYWED